MIEPALVCGALAVAGCGGGGSVAIASSSTKPRNLDEFIKLVALLDPDKVVITKQQKTVDGFVVLSHKADNGVVRADVFKWNGNANLSCRASQAKNGGVANADAVTAWLENLCNTLVVE